MLPTEPSNPQQIHELQIIADRNFNAAFGAIRSEQLKAALIKSSALPEPRDQALAMIACLQQMDGETDALKALIQFHIAHAFVNSSTGEQSTNLETALFYFEEAGKFYTKERDPFAWARVQNGFACCYGKYQKNGAGANIERSIYYLRLTEQVFSKTNAPYDWAYTQNNLGSAYLDRLEGNKTANVKTATAYFEAALTVQSKIYCPEAWALSMTNLGEAYNNRFAENRINQAQQAIAIFEEVATLYTETSNSLQWALLQRRIGNVYVTLASADPFNHTELALRYFLKAKAILTPERYPNEWVVLMRQMGDAFSIRLQGDPMVNQESAIACYMSSFAIVTTHTQPYSWATLHHALALIYRVRFRGNMQENMALSKRHINEAKQVLTKENYPTDWASLEHLQGILALEHRKPNLAVDFENAITHFTNALSIRNPDTAFHLWTESMNSLAGAYTDRPTGEPLSNLQKGIQLYGEVLSKLSPETNLQNWCLITTDLARALMKAGADGLQQNRAAELLEEVLQLQTPVNHPRECFKVAYLLGKLHFENSRFKEALQAFRKSYASYENFRVQSIHDFFRRQLSAETPELFQCMVSCCLQLGDADQAFYYASAGKARVFADLLQSKQAASPATDLQPKAKELQQKIDALRLEIDQLTTSTAYLLTGGHFLNKQKVPLLTVVAEKRTELLAYLEEMALRFPDMTDARQAPAVSTAQLKQLSANRPQECWVEYYRDTNGWGAFLMKDGKLDYVALPEVNYRLLNDLYTYMAEAEKLALAGKIPAMPDTVLEEHLSGLYKTFVAPLCLQLPAGSRIVLSLTQELALLPINIAYDVHSSSYFCENYALSFIPGLNAYYWLLQAEQRLQEKPSAQLLTVVHAGHTKATRLRFASLEVELVATHFAPPPLSILLDEKKALMADIITQCNSGVFDAIHFACHGHFNSADAAQSGLTLGDGILTAERIQTSIRLKHKPLVLLSACQTAQKAMGGGDESIGLTASFFAAGAGTVIASQWSVNDESSMEIFRYYFERSKSASKSEALRQAMMEIKKIPKWKHPLYWAAFTITGLGD